MYSCSFGHSSTLLGQAMVVSIIYYYFFTYFNIPLIIFIIIHISLIKNLDLLGNRQELQCKSDTPAFWAIFISYKGAWLFFGAILAFLTRNVAEEYNESKSIAYAVS